MRIKQSNRVAPVTRWCGVAAIAAWSGVAMADPCTAGGAIANHGQHIVGDYVTGLGGLLGDGLNWPPKGQVGAAVSAAGGAVLPGGPGPAFHFGLGFPPGASADFCNPNAHPNGFKIPGPFAPPE